MTQTNTVSRKPISLFWSAVPFAVIILILGIGAGVYHLNVSVLLLASAAITGCIAWAHKISWQEMETLHGNLLGVIFQQSNQSDSRIGKYIFAIWSGAW